MFSTRPAAVAGRFYPADPTALRQQIRTFAPDARDIAPAPKALIAPHAGYPYSGPIVGRAYARLYQARNRIERVVLLGPAHFVRLRGLALPEADAFETPLGITPVDTKAATSIADLPQVIRNDRPHASEHSLEVHLPFLQATLETFSVVPIVVGDASHEEVATVIERLWGGPETLIVISTDLSHYLDHTSARRMDAATAEAIEALQPERIGFEQACGRIPLGGLLQVARRRGMRVERLDLRNSGDTAGPRNQVVGYGAWAVFEGGEA
ncbi:MAG: AmmeMemoRadiSam system protein B [Pseudomonadota bacterium]